MHSVPAFAMRRIRNITDIFERHILGWDQIIQNIEVGEIIVHSLRRAMSSCSSSVDDFKWRSRSVFLLRQILKPAQKLLRCHQYSDEISTFSCYNVLWLSWLTSTTIIKKYLIEANRHSRETADEIAHVTVLLSIKLEVWWCMSTNFIQVVATKKHFGQIDMDLNRDTWRDHEIKSW